MQLFGMYIYIYLQSARLYLYIYKYFILKFFDNIFIFVGAMPEKGLKI